MVTFSLTVKGQLSQILRFCLLFLQNLNDDPFHMHDKRLFCQITYQIDSLQKRLRKEICCIWAGPPARHTAGLDSSTRAARNARQAARGQHDRPNAAHTVLLLRYFGGKQKSATLRILRKVLPPQLPLKLPAFQDETNLGCWMSTKQGWYERTEGIAHWLRAPSVGRVHVKFGESEAARLL